MTDSVSPNASIDETGTPAGTAFTPAVRAETVETPTLATDPAPERLALDGAGLSSPDDLTRPLVAETVGKMQEVRTSERAAPAHHHFPFSAPLAFEAFVLDAPRMTDTLAGLKGRVMRRAMFGEVFQVTGIENGFARVHEGRRYGYISADAFGLRVAPKETATVPAPASSERAVPRTPVRLGWIDHLPRECQLVSETAILAAASEDSVVIRLGRPGERVWVTAVMKGFAALEGGVKGYVVAEAAEPTVGAGRSVPRTPVRPSPMVSSAVDSPRGAAVPGSAGLFGRLLFLLGGAGMVASPFLPWVSANLLLVNVSASLYDLAKMTGNNSGFAEVLIIGGFTALGGLLRSLRMMDLAWSRAWGLLGGGAGIAEVIVRYNWFRDQHTYGLVTLEFGFYLLAVASVVAIAGIIIDSGG